MTTRGTRYAFLILRADFALITSIPFSPGRAPRSGLSTYIPSYEKAVPDGLPNDFTKWRLASSFVHTHDTKILRFQLPKEIPNLQMIGAPAGIKVRRCIDGVLLDKSMSPISHPASEGYVDLLVRSYGHPPESQGLGAFLCGMMPGDSVEIKLKPRKLFGGMPWARQGFANVGLIGCGTGVAPLVQIAREILPADPTATIKMISAHRTSMDILLGNEIETLERKYPSRFQNTFVLSSHHGRISEKHVADNSCFISPSSFVREQEGSGIEAHRCHVVVCGTDDFVDTVCGPLIRVAVEGKVKKRKTQGPLKGLLKSAGFVSSEVTKL